MTATSRVKRSFLRSLTIRERLSTDPINPTNAKRKPVLDYRQLERQAIAEIGRIIKIKRRGLGLTQKELASSINLATCTLSNLESGKVYKEVRLFMLLDIAKIVKAEKEVLWFIGKLLEIERPQKTKDQDSETHL